jgi:hypothetical protein
MGYPRGGTGTGTDFRPTGLPVDRSLPVDQSLSVGWSILPSQTSDEKFDVFTRKKRIFLYVKKIIFLQEKPSC